MRDVGRGDGADDVEEEKVGGDASHGTWAVYMWGRGKDHRLGLLLTAPMAVDVMEPTVLPSSGIDRWYGALSARARVAQVSCGGSHTALVMRDGGLFTVGHGLYGQLGLGPRIRRTNGLMRVCGVVVPEHSGRAEAGSGPGVPTPTTAAAAPSTTTRAAAAATTVSMPPVRAVTCGRYHCLACTPDGHVYAWGGGKNGRLGTGVELRSFLPWPIDRVYEPVPGQPMNVRRSRNIPTECRVAAVECGYHHSLVLSTDGALFSCGWGAHGQLGHGVQQDEPSLLRVTFYDAAGRPDPSVKVARVAGGDRHTLALTTDGRVFGFGSNEFGQLGLSGMPPPPPLPASSPAAELAHGPPPPAARVGNVYPKPVQLQGGALAGRRIVYVACGERHSVALSDQGEVICWGHGASGQLGLGAGVTAAATPQLMQAPTLRGSRVVHVCCGHESTLFMTADKRLFVTGSGEYGLLGVGPQAPRVSFEPLQARLPPQVVIDGVAMGHFHASLWGVRLREHGTPDPMPRYTALGRVGGSSSNSSSG